MDSFTAFTANLKISARHPEEMTLGVGLNGEKGAHPLSNSVSQKRFMFSLEAMNDLMMRPGSPGPPPRPARLQNSMQVARSVSP